MATMLVGDCCELVSGSVDHVAASRGRDVVTYWASDTNEDADEGLVREETVLKIEK
jgi:hypothetical protein